MLDRVEPDHLVTTLAGGLGLGDEGRGVVAGAFRLARAAGRGAAVVLGEPDGDRLDAAGEVGAGGRGDEDKETLGSGPDPETDLGRHHERAQVKAVLAA